MIGRWLSRDPIGERGGDNLYAFVENVPTMFMDFLGLSPGGHNSPSGNLAIPFSATPEGEAMVVVDPQWKAQVQKNPQVGAVLMSNHDDSTIPPVPVGPARWYPMGGGEENDKQCRLAYKCVQRCACLKQHFDVEWKGSGDSVVYGTVSSTLKYNTKTKQFHKDKDGNDVYINAKCNPTPEELEKAKVDCANTSKGKCASQVKLAKLASNR
jgi:uncharacterized protein RhaS with RHS repeats